MISKTHSTYTVVKAKRNNTFLTKRRAIHPTLNGFNFRESVLDIEDTGELYHFDDLDEDFQTRILQLAMLARHSVNDRHTYINEDFGVVFPSDPVTYIIPDVTPAPWLEVFRPSSGDTNTWIGRNAMATSVNNIAIGYGARTTGSACVAIGLRTNARNNQWI